MQHGRRDDVAVRRSWTDPSSHLTMALVSVTQRSRRVSYRHGEQPNVPSSSSLRAFRTDECVDVKRGGGKKIFDWEEVRWCGGWQQRQCQHYNDKKKEREKDNNAGLLFEYYQWAIRTTSLLRRETSAPASPIAEWWWWWCLYASSIYPISPFYNVRQSPSITRAVFFSYSSSSFVAVVYITICDVYNIYIWKSDGINWQWLFEAALYWLSSSSSARARFALYCSIWASFVLFFYF